MIYEDNQQHKRLLSLYEKADKFNDSIPLDLSRKIEMYCEILMIIGRMHAAAQFAYGQAYAQRKREHGVTLAITNGTQADKHGAAEEAAYNFRMKEAEAEAELVRWKNAFIATQELIQAMKKTLEMLKVEYNGGRGY